ncbi:MAG: PAS domain S-box protein [bacterium]
MKKKILLVEDEAIIAISEAQMLQKHGFEVITAYKGERALELIDELADISLVLMDIDLGKGIDGTEAAQKILEKRDLPVVFLSSHTEPEIVEKTEGITSYGYIVKNSGETVMLASIRMAFRLYAAHMELKRQKDNLRRALVKQEITEEKLIEKSDELERYFDSSLDLLCIATTEGELVRLNPEWEKVLGYSISELEGRSFLDFVHAEDVASTLQAVSKLSRQELIQNFENRYKCKDGTYRWIEWRSRSQGDMIYAVARDVTDRKKAEAELRESEEKFRTLMEQSIDMLFLHDMDGNIIDVNSRGEEMTGYSRSELLSMTIPDLDPDYYQREDSGAFWREINYNESFQFQARLIRKDGTIFWIDVVLAKVKINGRTLIMTLSRDITERLNLYEALKKSEEKYRMLYENAPMPYQSLDENGCFLEVNPAWLEILGGYTKEEVIGKSFSEFIHPDSLHDFKKNLAAFKKTGKAENNVYKMRKKNGEYIDASFKGCIAYSQEGKFLRTHCVFADITQLKAAEESVKNHAKRLELTMKNARVAWWEMEVSTGKVDFSQQKTDMLGYSPGDFKHYADFTAVLHPDDYDNTMSAMRRHLEGKADRYDVEYRILTSSGEYRWFHDVGSIVARDTDGTPLHVAGIVIDVTQQKEMELALKKQSDSTGINHK